MAEPVLSARQVHVRFDTPVGRVHAVRGVDLDIHPGETVALVGESGSGKSAFAKSILRLHQPPFTRPRTTIEGRIDLACPDSTVDLVEASARVMRTVRATRVGMVFQDALSALNPVVRVGRQIAEALRAARPELDRDQTRTAAVAILEQVGMPDPERRARVYPHQLSGGQRQRVMIAIAAIRSPSLLIADEPTTALDVTVQARLLRLFKRLQEETGMAILFITHDLGVVAQIADRVAVMQAGEIVELADATALFVAPRHPYTAALLASMPGRRGA